MFMISMPEFQYDVLLFKDFDRLKNVNVLSLAWRFIDEPNEKWTFRLNQFKSNDMAAIQSACRLYTHVLSQIRWENSLKRAIICAIPSSETSLPLGSALYTLGNAICECLGWQWHPKYLTKKTHRKIHSLNSASSRDSEVDNVYSTCYRIDADVIIILDDFITRGATVADIVRAVRVSNPEAKIGCAVLGKNERRSYAKSNGFDISNGHLSDYFQKIWDANGG